MQDVDNFNYLRVMISTDGGLGEKVSHRLLEGRKVWGKVAKLWKEDMISREVKRQLYGGVVISTVVYDSETCLSAQERSKIEIFEMCLRNI